MDNKVLAAIFGGIALLCVTVLGVAFIVTGSDDTTPAPVVTATATPSPTADPLLSLLEKTWDQQSYSDQKSLCWLFNTDADAAFNAFNDGAEGLVPESTFMEFFSVKCASIT